MSTARSTTLAVTAAGTLAPVSEGPLRRDDIAAIGELLGEALDGGGRLVQDTHAAIAERTFTAIGPASRPVQVIHDGIAGAVYRGVRGALRGAAKHGSAA